MIGREWWPLIVVPLAFFFGFGGAVWLLAWTGDQFVIWPKQIGGMP